MNPDLSAVSAGTEEMCSRSPGGRRRILGFKEEEEREGEVAWAAQGVP